MGHPFTQVTEAFKLERQVDIACHILTLVHPLYFEFIYDSFHQFYLTPLNISSLVQQSTTLVQH